MRISVAKCEIFLCAFQMADIVNSPDVFENHIRLTRGCDVTEHMVVTSVL